MWFWTVSSVLSLKGHTVRRKCSCAPWRAEFSVIILFVIPLYFLVQIYSVPICLVLLLNKASNKWVQVEKIFLLIVSGNVSLVPVVRRTFSAPSSSCLLGSRTHQWQWEWSSNQWQWLAMAGACSGVWHCRTWSAGEQNCAMQPRAWRVCRDWWSTGMALMTQTVVIHLMPR